VRPLTVELLLCDLAFLEPTLEEGEFGADGRRVPGESLGLGDHLSDQLEAASRRCERQQQGPV
jgi:hypothetical protein